MATRRVSASSSSSEGEARPVRRRGRPPSIDREKLLEVARDVFLEKGVRATTLEVAQRAGVSEGALFHHFKTKDALFHSALDFDEEALPASFIEMVKGATASSISAEEGLLELATHMFERGKVTMPLLMMSWANPSKAEQHCFPSEAQLEKRLKDYNSMVFVLASYLEKQIQVGQLRSLNTEHFARAFIGAIHHGVIMAVMFDQTEHSESHEQQKEFVNSIVSVFLQGAAVQDDRKSVDQEKERAEASVSRSLVSD